MSSHSEDEGHILDSPLSYHFVTGGTFRNSWVGGGLLGWRKWRVGRWPGWCSDGAPRQPVYFSLSQGELSLWGSSEGLARYLENKDSGSVPRSGGLCTQRLRGGSVHHRFTVHWSLWRSPRLRQSVETPVLGKGRQCPLASPCPLQGGGLSCWAKEEALAKEQPLPDRRQEWRNMSKLGKAHRVKG